MPQTRRVFSPSPGGVVLANVGATDCERAESRSRTTVTGALARCRILPAPHLRVGLGWIDDQHEELFDLHNQLVDTLAEGSSSARFAAGFAELLAYVRRHFAEEERFMAELRYPGRHDHALTHRCLLHDAEDFAYSLSRVFGPAECLAVARYLRLWLTRHIGDSDLALGRYTGH